MKRINSMFVAATANKQITSGSTKTTAILACLVAVTLVICIAMAVLLAVRTRSQRGEHIISGPDWNWQLRH